MANVDKPLEPEASDRLWQKINKRIGMYELLKAVRRLPASKKKPSDDPK